MEAASPDSSSGIQRTARPKLPDEIPQHLSTKALIFSMFFWKAGHKHFGFYCPAFASSPHSCLVPGFTRQSGLGGQYLLLFSFCSELPKKPNLSAQAFVTKRDGSGIPRFFIGNTANSPTEASL
ncbi:hypothetical protein CA265_03180 [Sphingobacteriaceae bacterium GW460-11-11-14-LB5]|nr:hypothetical protein CA265_03180 [Sphingobacteriaceae bacterium GW460-11-11-14-LB5]